MDENILSLEQACEFLGVSMKTMIKTLQTERAPARKIGREWRLSKDALIEWISGGDSSEYRQSDDKYAISEEIKESSATIMNKIAECSKKVLEEDNIQAALGGLAQRITLPKEATLQVSYKQKRGMEELKFELYWDLREEYRMPKEVFETESAKSV